MSSQLPNDASIPINFCGSDLPLGTYWLELIAYICPEISDEAKDWTLDIHYCGGTVYKMQSAKVIKFCEEIASILESRSQHIINELIERLPEYNATELINEWKIAILKMTQLANQSAQCVWWRQASVSEIKNAKKTLLSIIETFKFSKELNKKIFNREDFVIEQINAATDEECLDTLKDLLKSMSNNEEADLERIRKEEGS
jgi:hypothetical protein